MMTRNDFVAEVKRRIGIDEGDRLRRYLDSLGIPTIGEGFNLQRDDARAALAKCGVTDVDGVLNGTVALTPEQDAALFAYAFAPIEDDARSSLASNVYDTLSDERRFVICDMVYNLGLAGWTSFANTRLLINEAQEAKNAGDSVKAHLYFGQAANHMEQSEWYGQVGDRAKRNCAMMRTSEWCDPNGDGSDVL